MTESFLHYTWKYRLFNSNDLFTSKGEKVEIISPGLANRDAGPDFFNAKIKIQDQLWAGNVEIHLKSSDWVQHKHSSDKAYNNIILHVVHNHDKELFRENGERIPVLEIKDKIPENIYSNYLNLYSEKEVIACKRSLPDVDPSRIKLWLERMMVERLQRKSEEIKNTWLAFNKDWNQTWYFLLAGALGSNVNRQPFELLAKSLPLNYLLKHKDHLHQVEAMLFGQAGFLEGGFIDGYPKLLKKEYGFLKQKFNLSPIENHLWKFLRLRPANFPTVRISQLASLIHQTELSFSSLIEFENPSQFHNILNCNASDYWQDHYVFDKGSEHKTKYLGKTSKNLIIINIVAPLMFLYSDEKEIPELKDKALDILEQTEPENNHIVSQWKEAKIKPDSAFKTQSLIQLYNNYCKNKRCLECGIGSAILK
jgi:hypothetical protein